MANKKKWLGILIMVLVFGLMVVGCASQTSYYNLGNVSESNSAQVQVLPIVDGYSNYDITDFKINGQGGLTQWNIKKILPLSKAIVRVPPGEHTFTVYFNPGVRDAFTGKLLTSDMSVSVTYDCKAGMGYFFEFQTRETGNTPTSPILAAIAVFEAEIDEKGNFGGVYASGSLTTVNMEPVAGHGERIIPSW